MGITMGLVADPQQLCDANSGFMKVKGKLI